MEDIYLNKKKVKELGYNLTEEERLAHNKEYVRRKLEEHKEYFDHMFDDIDTNIKLDTNQRIAIITNEDYNLVVAGAGSGKTITMVAKIKYMVDILKISPKSIIAISFAKKNVEELNNKLNNTFNLNIDTMTFHKLGNTILNDNTKIKRRVIEDSQKYKILNTYYKEELYKNKEDLTKLVHFLYYYLNGDKDMENFNSLEDYHKYKVDNLFSTVKEDLYTYNQKVISKRAKYRRSINSEYLRSNEEVQIANFLYLYGLEYEYEPLYKNNNFIDYRPDFLIKQGENAVYLEHYGITENGVTTLYSKEERDKYVHTIKMKDQMHKRNSTILLKTYSKFNDGRSLIEHLMELLKENGFKLIKRNEKEIFDTITKNNIDNYFYKFNMLLMDFISKFKLEYYSELNIENLISFENPYRTNCFLKVIIPIFNYYENYLKEFNLIDFEEMITGAIRKLKDNKEYKPVNYEYIIIDEYQDISKQRYDLIKELANHCNSKLTAVGDDWQSIFGFAGANVDLFSNFTKHTGYAEIIRITNTYRNSQELIDTAGKFVSKDLSHIVKNIKSNKHLDKPIVIYSYNNYTKKEQKQSSNIIIGKAEAIQKAIFDIISLDKNAKIMLIGRYGFDLFNLCQNSKDFKIKEGNIVTCVGCEDAHIEFYTVHKSKGLEFDYTIIINAIDSTYGFPSKAKDDPIFTLFNKKTGNIAYAEERRLFYVALTRTKNKVYIITPRNNPSPFIKELYQDKNLEFKDDVIEHYNKEKQLHKCPNCNSPLKKMYIKEINGEGYVCTNEKELCDFKTVELNYKIKIEKCDKCNDGYLIFKQKYDDHILLGCTNYSSVSNKCNNIKNIK